MLEVFEVSKVYLLNSRLELSGFQSSMVTSSLQLLRIRLSPTRQSPAQALGLSRQFLPHFWTEFNESCVFTLVLLFHIRQHGYIFVTLQS